MVSLVISQSGSDSFWRQKLVNCGVSSSKFQNFKKNKILFLVPVLKHQMVLITEVGAVQSTVRESSTKSKKASSYHYPDDIIRVNCVINNNCCSEVQQIKNFKEKCKQRQMPPVRSELPVTLRCGSLSKGIVGATLLAEKSSL